mmetsp:Transcript_17024/g.31924  ORF Transcript_17024/g.31924 Transcript_17024/m.31924 type:complete len:347 (+) Transcript_17024:73-1113(+)
MTTEGHWPGRLLRVLICVCLQGGSGISAISKPNVIVRREGAESGGGHGSADERGQAALLQEAVNKTWSARICPGAVTCGERADNLIFDEACWNCETGRIKEDYQELFCEKSSLTTCSDGSPCPTYMDVCANPGTTYRGAYCKKFAELSPPVWKQNCWYRGSEYKELYCDYFRTSDTYVPMCAGDAEQGETFCLGFAHHFPTVGYIECHSRLSYMQHHCLEQQSHNRFDPPCAEHEEIGGKYCRTFARNGSHAVLLAECVKHDSYVTLFCDIKASQNETVQTCASNPRTRGMYCQELAIKKNGFADCWGVGSFANTYCAEISWNVQSCRLLGQQEAQAELETQQAAW